MYAVQMDQHVALIEESVYMMNISTVRGGECDRES